MKKLLLIVTLLCGAEIASAQSYANLYVWQDTVLVTASRKDSVFATRWESVTFYFENGDGYVKVGAPDTTLSSKPWQYVPELQMIVIGPQTPLLKLAWRGGTATKLAMWGTKKIKM